MPTIRFDAPTADKRWAIARALADVLGADRDLATDTLLAMYDDKAIDPDRGIDRIELAHAFVNAYRTYRDRDQNA